MRAFALFPQPSPNNSSLSKANVGGNDSGVSSQFVWALLAKVIPSHTPSVTVGCLPATFTPAVDICPSSSSGHSTQPSPVEDSCLSMRQPTSALVWTQSPNIPKLIKPTSHHLLKSNIQPRSQAVK